MIGEVVKSFLIRCALVATTIFGLCLAVEFCSVPTQSSTIQIQGLHNQQFMSLQSIPSCDTYKHRNNKYFTENLNEHTVSQLQQYFSSHHYSEQEILDQQLLYLSDEFVKLAKTYDGYEQAIDRLHKKFSNWGRLQKVLGTFFRTYSSGLKLRIQRLYQEVQCKNVHQEEQNRIAVQQKVLHSKYLLSDVTVREYQELQPVYEQFSPLLAQAITKRMNAHSQIKNGEIHFSVKTYQLNEESAELLKNNGIEGEEFKQCSGNQLQHVIHEESLNILEHVASLSLYSVLHPHKNALVDCAAALSVYNKEGLVDKASTIADFCWTLLDYGQAIAEGAALGLYLTAQDLITNPIEVTVCLIAGKQVLAYQLCKVLYNVADIGVTAINDYDHAKEKLDDYIAPVNDLIAAIEKKEITMRDSLKAGTAFVVGYKAQSKLLGGLGKFFTTIKQSAMNFSTNNPFFSAQEYLTTPEGMLLKVTNQVKKGFEKTSALSLKKVVEDKLGKRKSIKHLIKQEGLPCRGKLRYVPPKKLHSFDRRPHEKLANGDIGFIDRFGNVWTKGRSITRGQPHEWDVQLSKQGISQVGWMTRDNSHLNVSLDGKVTHK